MKTYATLTIIVLLFHISSYAQPLGFLQAECGLIVNPNYSYTNYQLYPHNGYGYRLVHNGKTIIEGYQYDILVKIVDLKFIDEITGFLTIFENYDGSCLVYKIVDDSVYYLGECPALIYNSFIINKNTIYISSGARFPGQDYLFLTKFSDLHDKKQIFSMDQIVPDTTIIDTVFGNPICPMLNRLDFRYLNSTDTMIYSILLRINTQEDVSTINSNNLIINPNPASQVIHIRYFSESATQTFIILDILGRMKKKLRQERNLHYDIDITELGQGIYFLLIETGKSRIIKKFVKF